MSLGRRHLVHRVELNGYPATPARTNHDLRQVVAGEIPPLAKNEQSSTRGDGGRRQLSVSLHCIDLECLRRVQSLFTQIAFGAR